ncbi:hypothetical protein ACOSP7_016419 [Xanthoceras sorbifolium]|uniref:PGG domain-containing protein n=1 Tax=Xanthoceras sorbifolium TaxID=99658 RepID=A0ABQ8HJ03_9ROSI|nr:hypothetical protein JRO89_XS10G0161500 [Xanthoceras sorbifolium]KAH7561043.1 hypothetical protein JRO89_XS10G0162100 [Xanthoceras sorbifolium]
MYSLMCSSTDDLEKHKINSELYDALMMREDEKKVIELCRKVPDHALHILTVHDDTVIHMAVYSKKSDLVLKLLDELPDMYLDKMTRQNQAGNTILHETATSNHALPVADKVLRTAPGLLGMRNNNGETALFRSARYGKSEIFNFLAGKLSGYDQASKMPFLQRTDKTSVLHMSILAEHYDVALQIANDYKYLIGEKDADDMTALQLLACKPEAFNGRREQGFFFSKLIHRVIRSCSSALREEIKKEEEKYKAAVELAEFLIKRDTSWELSFTIQDQSRPRIHKYGSSSGASVREKGSGGEVVESAESALFLATKSGCIEMVKRILKVYPQAIEYIDDEGRNILHVAIKYRQLEIFEYVKHMEVPMMRFIRKIDNNGNTVLHMTGIKRSDYVPEKMEGPALVLQEELLWFERVKKVMESMPHFMTHQNNMRFTADGLFAFANNDLRLLSIEWLKHTVEGCSVVAVLIATVAFAAIYTVPGGINESTGKPVLINHPFFAVFTVTDVLSLTCSLTSVVTLLSILSSPFRLQDFKHSLPDNLMVGFTFLFLSVVMMMVAFAATILLMIKNKESWTKIMLYTFSFVPVGIFSLTYFPVYIKKSLERAGEYFCDMLKQLIPQSLLSLFKYISCFSICARDPATGSSIP